MFKEPNVADELSEARAALIRMYETIISADDLSFLRTDCISEIVKEIKRNDLALALGEYRYSVIDSGPEIIALVKAMVLKEALELRGLKVVILNPEPETGYRTRFHSRTIVISGWVK